MTMLVSPADRLIAGNVLRRTRTGAVLVAATCAGTAASTSLTYVATFPTAASRSELVNIAGGVGGMDALMGSTSHLDTVGGYTAYKGFVFLTTIAAVWAVLAATRTMRGSEADGQSALVLSGPMRPQALSRATLIGLICAGGLTTVATACAVYLVGLDDRVGFTAHHAVAYAVSMTIAPLAFFGIGAVASQLAKTRRSATILALSTFAGFTVVRMVADSTPAMHWMRWATPLGWVELMTPLEAPRWGPAMVGVAFAGMLFIAAIEMSGRRDVGDVWSIGWPAERISVRSNDRRRVRLTSPLALAARLEGSSMVAWVLGLLSFGLLMGVMSKITVTAAPGEMGEMLERFGTSGSFTQQFFGVAFLMLACVVLLIPAAMVGSMADEVTSRRIETLLAAPVKRQRWFWGRVALIIGTTVVAAFLSGVGTWIGARSQGISVSIRSMLGAGLNVVPLAMVVVGIGLVAFALVPRLAATIVYTVVLWSLFVDLVGSLMTGAAWMEWFSLFRYLALAPAAPVSTPTQVGLIVVAAALTAAAARIVDRRDL